MEGWGGGAGGRWGDDDGMAFTTGRPRTTTTSPRSAPHALCLTHFLHLGFTSSGWRTIILWYPPTFPCCFIIYILLSHIRSINLCLQSCSSPVPPPLLLTPSSYITLSYPLPSPSLQTFCSSLCPLLTFSWPSTSGPLVSSKTMPVSSLGEHPHFPTPNTHRHTHPSVATLALLTQVVCCWPAMCASHLFCWFAKRLGGGFWEIVAMGYRLLTCVCHSLIGPSSCWLEQDLH